MLAAGVLATSCVKDLQVNNGGDAVVSFNVGAPEIATKAFSDGMSATVLQYAVYDEAGVELTDLTVTDAVINGSATVDLQLTTGNTYSIIFWAAAEGAPYKVDFAAKTMKVDYEGALSNAENRDAFYKYHTFTVTGAQTETIELKRPFAQLNIATADYAAAKSAGYEPTKSAVTVKSIYSTLNLWTGEVADEAVVTYDYAAIPAGETFPVEGYDYLSMNYLLVAADKALVDIEFGYTETDAAAAKTRTVGSVPVQRNHRTNIYGNLLTSDVDINVEIKPEYDEPDYEADDFMLALAVGGELDMENDIDLGSAYVNINKGVVINANGNTLNVAEGQVAGYGALVSEGATAIFNDANIVSGGAGINVQAGSKVEFNGGSIVVNSDTNSGQRYIFYAAQNGTVVTINGGTFSFTHPIRKIAYICADWNAKVYVTGGEFGAPCQHPSWKEPIVEANGGEVIISGGTFGFDPTAWLANGYKAVDKDGKWYVIAEEATAVATSDTELREALKNNENVVLFNDINTTDAESNGYGATGINVNGGVLDGNGHTIEVEGATSTWDSAIAIKGGTIKNLIITKGFRGIFIKNGTEKVVLENVVIDGPTYTISCDQAGKQGIEAYNSTFNGWTSYAGTIGTAKFDGCSFGEGAGYAYCRPYAPTEFINCDFEENYSLDARATVTFHNCTIAGAALTAENLSTLVTGNIANASVK